MLEHDGYLVAQGSSRTDHPAAPPEPGTLRVYEDSGFLWVDGSNSTDVSYHATRAYYEIYGSCAPVTRRCCWRCATTAVAWSISAVLRTATIFP